MPSNDMRIYIIHNNYIENLKNTGALQYVYIQAANI